MLIGYVSDERYVALTDVAVLVEGRDSIVEARSTANGSIRAQIHPGRYRIYLNKDGYGPKCVTAEITQDRLLQFRLLSLTLSGYAWPKWVRGGGRAEFRVHSQEEYRLSLWRYGYQKEWVRSIGWFDEHGPGATIQITPDGDYTQAGVQWNKFGYTSPHHRQSITAPSRSGLYYFHAETPSGGFFTFPWVVAPATPQCSIAVLTSNITWNAYNNFGGRSNYIHPDRLPDRPTMNARLELRRYTDPEHVNYDTEDYAPISFDRPETISHIPRHVTVTDPIEGRAACHTAPSEWRLLGWLEREGFDYDLYADTQFHSGDLDLDNYRVLILGPHPEYWSSHMYFKLKKWVHERGGALMYLGGNGLNCDVEFVDEHTCIYRNEDERRLRSSNAAGESRFHLRHESEASLLGVVYDDRGIMTAAPYRVVDAGHWVFSGTGLRSDDLFGCESLHERVPGGASGHETDKMSAHSPTGTHLLAKGMNPEDGGAEMVFYQTESGGSVFATGSICWVSALLPDRHVSRITSNVLSRLLDR